MVVTSNSCFAASFRAAERLSVTTKDRDISQDRDKDSQNDDERSKNQHITRANQHITSAPTP